MVESEGNSLTLPADVICRVSSSILECIQTGAQAIPSIAVAKGLDCPAFEGEAGSKWGRKVSSSVAKLMQKSPTAVVISVYHPYTYWR